MLSTGKKLNRLKKSTTLLGFIREKRTQSKLLLLRLERERSKRRSSQLTRAETQEQKMVQEGKPEL